MLTIFFLNKIHANFNFSCLYFGRRRWQKEIKKIQQNPKQRNLFLQTGRTNGYIGLAFSYSDLPIGSTTIEHQWHHCCHWTKLIKTDFHPLDGFVAGVDNVDGQPYSADLHLDYAGKAPEIFNCIRIHKYLPRCGKEKVPFSSRHGEKHRSAGFKAYQEPIDILSVF